MSNKKAKNYLKQQESWVYGSHKYDNFAYDKQFFIYSVFLFFNLS